jgi:hypothetical protein
LHEPATDAVPVPPGVPGVGVVDPSGVDVGGASVGRDKPCFVGGRVDVTKIGAVGAGVSSETLMHEPRPRLRRASNIQIFCIGEFYFGKINASTMEHRTAFAGFLIVLTAERRRKP